MVATQIQITTYNILLLIIVCYDQDEMTSVQKRYSRLWDASVIPLPAGVSRFIFVILFFCFCFFSSCLTMVN